jgi:hypothetical protein
MVQYLTMKKHNGGEGMKIGEHRKMKVLCDINQRIDTLNRAAAIQEMADDMYRVMTYGRYTTCGCPADAVGLEFRLLHSDSVLETEYQFADKAGMERIEREVLAEVARIILRRLVGKTAE